ncbi:MAG: bifunctional DNA-formamidopyrimidine glycosylase/DNA-(apurinic or apyrimidinic site) lyase [Candidatus Aminicenantes bacterium]|nr:bifunctional DNA-formamidopyrimidine glycosylase/DNA-(apurinic or apyrimidinic site) lyase [Candidatus Aminicenantes bacterium]
MPELPEVETIVRSLVPKLKGLQIRSFHILYPPLFREKSPGFIANLRGKKICGVRRRGKMILIDCEGDMSLLVHLKMTGIFLFSSADEPVDKHTHFIISFEYGKRELRFRDVRKFGFVSCIRTAEASSVDELKSLGPEPLEIGLAPFQRLFQGRKARLKSLLLNQKFLAGIGNIYADEILFQARLHPLTPASRMRQAELKRMHEAMKDVLGRAIACQGSTIRDYRNAVGQEGNFQSFHQVYGREGLACTICGRGIRRIRLGGRSTFYCPGCQKEKKTAR